MKAQDSRFYEKNFPPFYGSHKQSFRISESGFPGFFMNWDWDCSIPKVAVYDYEAAIIQF